MSYHQSNDTNAIGAKQASQSLNTKTPTLTQHDLPHDRSHDRSLIHPSTSIHPSIAPIAPIRIHHTHPSIHSFISRVHEMIV